MKKEDVKFIPSTLKVTASENLDALADLNEQSDKSILELLNNNEEETEQNKNSQEENSF